MSEPVSHPSEGTTIPDANCFAATEELGGRQPHSNREAKVDKLEAKVDKLEAKVDRNHQAVMNLLRGFMEEIRVI
ncbi:hypothetical protein BDZ91DRAFT_796401 [Kalaharituber pfeilii]|nr:hypothetical protein BDZ91DRAFT_796401 [Kalaharituber pfeilii]